MKVMPSAGMVTSPVAVAWPSAADLRPVGERDVVEDAAVVDEGDGVGARLVDTWTMAGSKPRSKAVIVISPTGPPATGPDAAGASDGLAGPRRRLEEEPGEDQGPGEDDRHPDEGGHIDQCSLHECSRWIDALWVEGYRPRCPNTCQMTRIGRAIGPFGRRSSGDHAEIEDDLLGAGFQVVGANRLSG